MTVRCFLTSQHCKNTENTERAPGKWLDIKWQLSKTTVHLMFGFSGRKECVKWQWTDEKFVFLLVPTLMDWYFSRKVVSEREYTVWPTSVSRHIKINCVSYSKFSRNSTAWKSLYKLRHLKTHMHAYRPEESNHIRGRSEKFPTSTWR